MQLKNLRQFLYKGSYSSKMEPPYLTNVFYMAVAVYIFEILGFLLQSIINISLKFLKIKISLKDFYSSLIIFTFSKTSLQSLKKLSTYSFKTSLIPSLFLILLYTKVILTHDHIRTKSSFLFRFHHIELI